MSLFHRLGGFCGLLFLMTPQYGYAFDFAILGGSSGGKPSWQTTTAYDQVSAQTGYILGADGTFPLSSHLEVGTGIFMVQRKYSVKTQENWGYLENTASYYQMPLQIRARWTWFSLGGGVYASWARNPVTMTGHVGASAISQDFYLEDNGLRSFEGGWMASGRLTLPITRSVQVIGDLRYLSSLTNSYAFSSSELYYRDFQSLFGVGFQF